MRRLLLFLTLCLTFSTGFTEEKSPLPDLSTVPLSVPGVSNQVLLKWVTNTLIESFTFNPNTYKKTVDSLKKYYTGNGYTRLMNVLQNNPLLNEALNGKGSSTASLQHMRNAAVVAQDLNQFIVAWRIVVPLSIAYEDPKTKQTTQEHYLITVYLNRIPATSSTPGLAITEIFARLQT